MDVDCHGGSPCKGRMERYISQIIPMYTYLVVAHLVPAKLDARRDSSPGCIWRMLLSTCIFENSFDDDSTRLFRPSSGVAHRSPSETVLTASSPDPSVNKFRVLCGQSIEQWEAAGWIDYNFDPRGWLQWNTRFYQRWRCDDDERQIGRWKRCTDCC